MNPSGASLAELCALLRTLAHGCPSTALALSIRDAAVGGKRAQGKWHPLFHLITMIAIPLIYSVYVGIAEAARFHPLQEKAQLRYTGRLMLGLDIDG